ncbi:MAG TPA: IPT/TIG domain-containing protein [Solirubrobacteraceae bacterium]|nr:IPT/TIG domain-containing protein [Solirubrobacteraceae bacterium]
MATLSVLAPLVAALLLFAAALPAPSDATVPSGALSQLASPFNCVGEEGFHQPEIGCGTILPPGATKVAYQAQVSPDGRFVYSVAVEGALVEYERNLANGALTAIGCITASTEQCASQNVTTSALEMKGPQALAISPDGKSVYVVTFDDVLVQFERDPETGLLTEKSCIGHEATSACEQKGAKGLNEPYGVTVSHDGKNVYVASNADGAVAEFSRDVETGALTQLASPNDCVSSQVLSGCGTVISGHELERSIGVVESPDEQDVYIAAGATTGEGAIVALERDKAEEGALKLLPSTEACISEVLAECTHGVEINGPEDLVISPDGKNVYANSFKDNAVLELKREGSGALSQLAKPNACVMNAPAVAECTEGKGLKEPLGVAISPDGENVYASSWEEDDEAAFSRNGATGALTQLPSPYECVGKTGVTTCDTTGIAGIARARRVTVSPDGLNLYVAGQNDHAVVELARTVRPAVSRIDLTRGAPEGGEQVYIKGAGFAEGAKVFFGANEATSVTVHSAGSIVATSPLGAEGHVPVKVENAVGASAETAADEYTYSDAPAVAGVSADIGGEAGGTTVTVTGSQFTGATAVRFGSTSAASFKVESAETIVAKAPAGKGAVDVAVETAHGKSAAGTADKFTYIDGTSAPPSGLVLSSYCESIGDKAVTLEREEVGGPGYAYDNWACVANDGAETLIANTGPAPSMENACEHENGGAGFYGYPEDPNNAFSWGCHKVTPPEEENGGSGGGGSGGGGPFSKLPSEQIGPTGLASTPVVPPPVLARTGNVAPVSGTVLVKLPGTSTFVPLSVLRQIPFGSVIEATHGTVSVTTAVPGGGTQTGEFFQGEFILRQGPNGLVIAELTGGDFAVCPTARERAHRARVAGPAAAAAASRSHVVRKLWANAHGKFSTKGNYAAGAVQGTEWLTEDLCDGTLIRVTRDKVAVTNLVNHKHVEVRTGHKYLAKAP